jgi:hypothetical protein
MISISNLVIEASAVTFLMKNLSHYIPSSTQTLNAGFLLEIVEIISKFLTIFILLIGIHFNPTKNLLHNYLVMVFVIACVFLMLMTLINYG